MNPLSWQWAHPFYLTLLPVCLLPLILSFWQARRRGLTYTRMPLAREILRQPRQLLHYTLEVWQALAGAGLILALAQPWTPSTAQTDLAKNSDVLVVLDISRSMRADDVAPNRLGAAKQFITVLTARHPASRFGLVVFAGASQLRVPITSDGEMFADQVAAAEATADLGEGTAIGDALALGADRLGAAGQARPGSVTLPLLILLTDGANHTGRDPQAEAQRLSSSQVGFGVVGFGLEQPTVRREWNEVAQDRIPQKDVFGRVQTWEPLDTVGLQHLAASSGQGIFVRGDNPSGAAVLDPLWKRTPAGAGRRVIPGPRREWFWLPLSLALLALGLEFLFAKMVFRRLQDI